MSLQDFQLELLAPVRDIEIGIEAVNHGADAVYIGGPGFGARSSANSSVADIARLVQHAHRFNSPTDLQAGIPMVFHKTRPQREFEH